MQDTYNPGPLPPLKAFNFQAWIDRHRELLRPPVGNQQVFEDNGFIIMVVGGPNQRDDYHIDEGEEFFYQLEGEMVLRTIQNGERQDISIKAGEILLLPPRVPHSPQRMADSVGLVVERQRQPDELDGFQWYCDNCGALLHEEFVHVHDIVEQLPPIFSRFYDSRENRTCAHCGTVKPPVSQ
ncbi:MAG: 3-hydroxyanthranilate 3,4-dioxygenase [Pseudomonadota bacterium]